MTKKAKGNKIIENGVYIFKNEDKPLRLVTISGKLNSIDNHTGKIRHVSKEDIVRQIWVDKNYNEIEVGDIVVKLTESWNSKVGHEVGQVVKLSGVKPTVKFEKYEIEVWDCDLLIITPNKLDKLYSFINKP